MQEIEQAPVKEIATPLWRPEREIEIIAGTPPGGGLDRVARALEATFQQHPLLEKTAHVVNRPGDGARLAWTYVDHAARDPHVLSISSPNLTSDYLTGLAAFNHDTYSPLAILLTEYIAFAVRSDSPLRRGPDLLDRLARDPGSVTVALSTALGNPNHVAFMKLAQHAGADIAAPPVHVFDSALDAVADVVHGHADVAAVTAASLLPELRAGNIRTLAIASPEHIDGAFANTPTWLECGVDCIAGAWRGVTAPAGIEDSHRAFWEMTLRRATETPTWKAELARNQWSPFYLDGPALKRYLAAEDKDIAARLNQLGLLRAASR
jgi:putative tricarboxylic transport membrane protein